MPTPISDCKNLRLHSACASGNIGLVKFALDKGQPVDSCLNGCLPLHCASASGSVPCVLLLLERGADPNAPRLSSKNATAIGTTGSTPLHFAVANNHLPIVQILLSHGANTGYKDKYGVSPEDIAIAKNLSDVLVALQMCTLTPPPSPQRGRSPSRFGRGQSPSPMRLQSPSPMSRATTLGTTTDEHLQPPSLSGLRRPSLPMFIEKHMAKRSFPDLRKRFFAKSERLSPAPMIRSRSGEVIPSVALSRDVLPTMTRSLSVEMLSPPSILRSKSVDIERTQPDTAPAVSPYLDTAPPSILLTSPAYTSSPTQGYTFPTVVVHESETDSSDVEDPITPTPFNASDDDLAFEDEQTTPTGTAYNEPSNTPKTFLFRQRTNSYSSSASEEPFHIRTRVDSVSTEDESIESTSTASSLPSSAEDYYAYIQSYKRDSQVTIKPRIRRGRF